MRFWFVVLGVSLLLWALFNPPGVRFLGGGTHLSSGLNLIDRRLALALGVACILVGAVM